jgi:hypothetical protein
VHFGLLLSSAFCLVLQIKPDWLLEVALHGTALVLASEGIEDFNVDLGPVERAVAMVEGPRFSVLV